MPSVLLDVFQLQLAVPKGRPDAEIVALRRILDRRAFQRKLLTAAKAVFRDYPAFARIALTLTR